MRAIQTIALASCLLIAACDIDHDPGSPYGPPKPGDVTPPDVDPNVCQPVASGLSLSVMQLSGVARSVPDCGGGLVCDSVDDCTFSYTVRAPANTRVAGYVDAVKGMVFLSEWTALLAVQNNGGRRERLTLCARAVTAGERRFDVIFKQGAQIGRAAFATPAALSADDCKEY